MTLVAILQKDEMRFGIPMIARNEVGVALSKRGVHYGEVTGIFLHKDTLTNGST